MVLSEWHTEAPAPMAGKDLDACRLSRSQADGGHPVLCFPPVVVDHTAARR